MEVGFWVQVSASGFSCFNSVLFFWRPESGCRSGSGIRMGIESGTESRMMRRRAPAASGEKQNEIGRWGRRGRREVDDSCSYVER